MVHDWSSLGQRQHIVFNRAINLTAHSISFYDVAGSIATIYPGAHTSLLEHLAPDVMVIVTSEADGRAYGIPTENIVTPDSGQPRLGRGGIMVSRLSRPLDGAVVVFSPPETHYNTAEVYLV
ncbi:hypothetical protein IKL45_03785 [Candidatus Saccharibacteria bacterium]|nr:hypothetical protein [Candidatus Saccharibacteria bacterium]